MNQKQKRALASALIQEAGSLVEFWEDKREYIGGNREELLRSLDVDEVAEQLARWLKDLPGEYWDVRLPDVTDPHYVPVEQRKVTTE